MIKLGAEYKDKITDFIGVATGYVQYITGCNQVLLTPKVGKDGDKKNGEWVDEQRLERFGDKVIILDNGRATGFDMAAPDRG
jgi:hypothetical protein